MELGKIQKAWLSDLRKYPERQYNSSLGIKDLSGNIKACCLGQALLTLCEIEVTEPTWKVTATSIYLRLDDEGFFNYLHNSFQKLGLRDGTGSFIDKNLKHESLAQMNDGGLSWSEIADYIETNPENVFAESK